MESHESPVSVEDQIMHQRVTKIDRMLLPQPFLKKVEAFHGNLLWIHVGFVFIWMVSAGVSPRFAKFIAGLASPIAEAMFLIYRGYIVQDHFFGTMGNDFYRNVVGEAFFVGAFCGVLYAAIYIGRYWGQPWRFSQFLLEQMGTRASWVALFFYLLFATLIGCLLGLTLLIWYGAFGAEDSQKPIAIFQLGFWSMLIGGCASIFMLSAFSILSGFLFFLKKIGLLFADPIRRVS